MNRSSRSRLASGHARGQKDRRRVEDSSSSGLKTGSGGYFAPWTSCAATEAGKRARCGSTPTTGAFVGSWSRSARVVRPEGGETDEPERTFGRERETAETRGVINEDI